MQITEIKYRRLVNLGDYENEAVEATAIPADNEDPEQVRKELTKFVDEQLAAIKDERESARQERIRKQEEEAKAKIKAKREKAAKAKFMEVDAGVLYWNDSSINGEEDTDCEESNEAPRMPFAMPTWKKSPQKSMQWRWRPIIDIEQGKIYNWPKGTTADINYRVSQNFSCVVTDADQNVLLEYDDYVPAIMQPADNGLGDAIVMHIDSDGTIDNWDKQLIYNMF